MGNEIVVQNENQMIDFKAKAIEWLQSMGTSLPKAQATQFLELCQAYKLNPFKREIYAVGYNGKFNIITGYEVYLKRAERTGRLDGWQCVANNEGTKAKITIWRKDWSHPFEHEVFMSEVRQNSPIWQKMPIFMMKKVCTEQGMRLCFPDELGGMPYGEEEVSYDRVIQSDERNITPEVTGVEPNISEPIENVDEVVEGEIVDERQKLQAIVTKYESALAGVAYDSCCEALSGNDPNKISEMLGRCKTYLGKKGIKVA